MDESRIANSKRAVEALFTLWDRRVQNYGRVRFGSAIQQENGAWKHLVSYLLPLHKTEVGTFDPVVDYGVMKIVSGTVEIDKAKSVLRGVVEENMLRVPNLPEIALVVNASPDSIHRYNSSDRRLPVFYPFDEMTFSPDQQSRAFNTSRTLYSPELPLFPTSKAAVEEYLDTRLGDSTCVGSFFALAPDYRGRIWEVKLSTKGVQATVQCPYGSDPEDLVAKVYFQKPGGQAQYGDPPIVNGVASFPADDFPLWFTFALLSRSSGDLIDEKSHADIRYLSAGIVVESTEQDLGNLILGGESEVAEFKQQLPKGPELAREVVAFANTHGGRIVVGVTNDGEVTGFEMGNINDHVANLLRSFCEPWISVSIEKVSVRGVNIVVITVPEGSDKPYNAINQGFYVRSSGTTRRATRYELDQMRKGVL